LPLGQSQRTRFLRIPKHKMTAHVYWTPYLLLLSPSGKSGQLCRQALPWKTTWRVFLSISVRITMIRCVVYLLRIFKMFYGLKNNRVYGWCFVVLCARTVEASQFIASLFKLMCFCPCVTPTVTKVARSFVSHAFKASYVLFHVLQIYSRGTVQLHALQPLVISSFCIALLYGRQPQFPQQQSCFYGASSYSSLKNSVER
jgi:hypothetical protein